MGGSYFDPQDYQKGVDALKQTGTTFARSAQAQASGNFSNVADSLNPRKLKNGVREACFASGFDDATPIVVSIDATGSMQDVPYVIQRELPKLIGLLVEQDITDHPNVMFLCHDDEQSLPPDAAFQMSQFETGAAELLAALNELIIPHGGGGNRGEAYHLSIYAAARHTRLECFERDGTKGFFFLIGDEEPFYYAGDPAQNGTSREIAKEIFGDTNESTVTMLESLKELSTRYHVFVLRPGHTAHGRDRAITRLWQNLFQAAGLNPEQVLEVEETDALISTMTLAIGQLSGADQEELIEVLGVSGATGVASAAKATQALVPTSGTSSRSATTTMALATADKPATGRQRR